MTDNVLDLAGKRQHVLDFLRDGPYRKRDIVEAVPSSRSTVDRAIAELVQADLVTREDGGYRTTLAGVLALKDRERYDRNAEALESTAAALVPLWKETPLELDFLRGAERVLIEDTRSMTALSRLHSVLRNAESVRLLLPEIVSGEWLTILYTRVIEDGVDVELVCGQPLFETLVREYPGWVRELAESPGTIQTGDVPGFGLVVCEIPGGTQVFVTVFDEAGLHAILRNDTDDAVEWGDQCHEWFRERAERPTEHIASLPESTRYIPGSGNGPVLDSRAATSSSTASIDGIDADESSLLGSGYAVDDSRLRTPEFGAEGACTVAFWMKTDGFGDWETMVKWDYLAVGYRRGVLFAHIWDDEAEQERARVTFPGDRIRRGMWQHVAYTNDGEAARLYLDGDVADETEDVYPVDIRPMGACLGYIYEHRDTGVYEPRYHGKLADVRFYEAALSPELVRRLYRMTSPTNAEP